MCKKRGRTTQSTVGWALEVPGRESEMEVQRGPGVWGGVPRADTHLNCILKEKEALGKRRAVQKGGIL